MERVELFSFLEPGERICGEWLAQAHGTRYTLQKPSYSFDHLNYGPMHPGVMIGPRIAPQIIGVGLLEAIAESDILGNAAR